LLPSDRVIVPRSLAFALPDADAVPVLVTGGQAPAHAPVHADVPPASLVHRYTARPEPLVKNEFPDDEAVVMTVAPDPLAAALLGADAPAGEPLAAPGLLLLLPLEHAATSIAAPTAPPTPAASLAGAGIRFTMEFLIVFFSHLALPARPSPHSPKWLSIQVRAGARTWIGCRAANVV
jgi:hypothetical protein